MKKILTIIFIIFTFSVVAVSMQVWYAGTWATNGKYGVTKMYNTNTYIAQMVLESQNSKVYLTSGASAPIVGVKPESQPAAWINISG